MRPRAKIHAPDFPKGADWLNTDRPLTLQVLRGKIVLLDFWTYCCINCMHVLPELKRLERKYPDELVVVGVHSAKFKAEQLTENIRQAILRYEIEHPVINDHRMIMWREYGVRAWPTLVLIDPEGIVAGSISGEGVQATLDGLIAGLIEDFSKNGKLDRRPLDLPLERDMASVKKPERRSVLAFPGKVLADEQTNRLFIADSNHNRIVVVPLDQVLAGKTVAPQDVIGNGEAGLKDERFEGAMLNHPQGMAARGDVLYIADTENHLIRRANLKNRMITTIAGTGEKATTYNVTGAARSTALNSPWDLVLIGDVLFIAMAGPHQIWKLDLETDKLTVHAGTASEARIDGRLKSASLAQPSGLTTDGTRLYFADSEVSSIRAADIAPDGRVETLVGGDLFEFGDRDGTGLEVRLQHPLGVVYRDGKLYVADTYNNKIKVVDLHSKTCTAFLGTGEAGSDDAAPTFDEPGGITAADDKLIIADTNNHAIRIAEISTRKVTTMHLEEEAMEPLQEASGEIVRASDQQIGPGEVALVIDLLIPEGFKLNEDAPSSIDVSSSDSTVIDLESGASEMISSQALPMIIRAHTEAGDAELRADFSIYYCRESGDGKCYFEEARVIVPIHVAPQNEDRELVIEWEPELT